MPLGQQIASLHAKIGVDVSDLDKGLTSVSRKIDTFGSKLSGLGNKLTIGLTMPLLGAAAAMTKFAMDAVESENLFTVSFGDMADSARKFSEQMRDQLKLNDYEVRRNLGTWYLMFSQMGFGKQAALDMSEGLTKLSYDMSSFYNMKPDEAFEKLRSGIAGEIEPLRRLGVDMSEAAVQAWALKNGINASTADMSQAQKTAIRYQLALTQMSAAQGDLARTIQSPANQLRALGAQFELAATKAGEIFLPTVANALIWINNEGLPKVMKKITEFTGTWSTLSSHAKTEMLVVAGLFIAGGPLLKGIGIGIQGLALLAQAFGLLPKAAAIGVTGAGILLVGFKDQISGIFEGAGEMLISFGEGMKQAGGPAAWLGERISGLGRQWFNTAQIFRNKGLGGMAKDLATTGISAGIDALATRVESLGEGIFGTGDDALGRRIKRNLDYAGQGIDQFADVAVPKVALTKEAFDALAGPAGLEKTKKKAEDVGMSMGELANALTNAHPYVQGFNDRIDSINLALTATSDQLRAAQRDLQGYSDTIGNLQNELSEANKQLQEFTNPRLKGMGAMDRRIAETEEAIAAVQLRRLGGEKGLARPESQLQKQLALLQKQREVQYGPQLRQLQDAAQAGRTEYSFEEALAGISSTRSRIADLTASITAQQAAMASQRGLVADLQAESERLNAELATQKERMDLVNTALKIYFDWMLGGREKVAGLGVEGVRVAGVIDDRTRRLMDAIAGFVDDNTGNMQASVKTALKAYQRDVPMMLAELLKLNTTVTTTHVIETVYKDSRDTSGNGQTNNYNMTVNTNAQASTVETDFAMLAAMGA